jgi:hypothetical protein
MWVRLKRRLKRLDRALKIHRADAVLTEDIVRLLLVIRHALRRRLATSQHDAKAGGGGAEKDAVPKFHAAKLAERLLSCNCVVKKPAVIFGCRENWRKARRFKYFYRKCFYLPLPPLLET